MLYRAGFASVVAVAAFAIAPAAVQAQTCGEIELGAAVSATGIYAANGQNTKNGYEFALKKINDAGGVTIGGKWAPVQAMVATPPMPSQSPSTRLQ